MKKYKITTAKNAAQKGLLKEGDEIWVKVKVNSLFLDSIYIENVDSGIIYCEKTTIRIPITEPKPIDFGVAGRIFKYGTTVIMTTGFLGSINKFSGYVLESEVYDKGYTNNEWQFSNDWQDITDTYKP